MLTEICELAWLEQSALTEGFMAAAAEELPHKRRRLSEDISGSRCASPADATSAQPASPVAAGTQQQAHEAAQQAHARAQQPQAVAPAITCQGSSAEGQRSATLAGGAPLASAQASEVRTEQQDAATAAPRGAEPQQNGCTRAPAEAAAAAAAADCACEPRLRSSGSDGSGGSGSAPVPGSAAAGKKRGGSIGASDVPLAQQKPYLCTGFDCYVVQVLTFLPCNAATASRC